MDREPYDYRDDPQVPSFPDDHPIIVFDGECAFCSRWVRFALRHDRAATYRFLAAQSTLGSALYRHYGLSPATLESNILIKDGRAYFKAEGSLQAIGGLGLPWSLIAVVRVLPMRLLDRCYDFIAANRINWFGRTASCFVPTPEVRSRFIG
jgi:predicted DCC family thiol-disulfide oxidoreductase YuxK